MRFVVLIALLGLVAARCPFNNRRCFNQLIQNMQGQQGPYGQLYDDEDDSSDSDLDDYQTQYQQPGCWGGQCQDEDDDQEQYQHQDQDEDDLQAQCEQQGGLACVYAQQQQQQGGQQQCQPNYQLLQQLEQPNAALAAKLYKQAKQERDDKNTVVSPAAVQITLAALQKGARGSTKTQMKRAQCPGLTKQQCQQAHAAMIRSIKGTNNVQKTQRPGQQNNGQQKAKINCATAVIVNQQTRAQQQFVQKVQKCLGGQVKKCSFKTSPQQCRHQINRLVAAKTNQKIQNIVPQAAVTDNTKMIAVSALQLNAKWSQKFRQNQMTKIARFHPLGSQQPKQCQAIQSQGQFNYYEDEQVKVVGIPTQQQELTMYVIVPKDKDGLTQVEKQQIQNGQQLKELLDNCDQQKQHVQVQLPKVQIKHKMDAKKTLMQQGVQDAFDCDQADFSGICGQQQQQQQQTKLHLNKLIHQATIKINEQGISAANPHGQQSSIQEQIEQSLDQENQWQQQQQRQQRGQWWQQQQQQDESEYGMYGQGKYSYGQQQVKANRAFAFAVKHNPSNQILLVGRVIDGCQKPQGQPQGYQGQYEIDQDLDEQ